MPPAVRRFAITGAIIFLVWKAVYLLLLQPANWPDKPLVNAISYQTTWLLNAIKQPAEPYNYSGFTYEQKLRGEKTDESYEGYMTRIKKGNESLLLIVRNCNGLELMVLYAGFILAYPGAWKTRLAFIGGGIVAIHIVNVLRCAMLISMIDGPLKRFFHFTHHYLFTLSIYGFIFLLWYSYIKYVNKANGNSQ